MTLAATSCSTHAPAAAASSARGGRAPARRAHVAAAPTTAHRLWCLLMLELWQRLYLDAGALDPRLVTRRTAYADRRSRRRSCRALAVLLHERGDSSRRSPRRATTSRARSSRAARSASSRGSRPRTRSRSTAFFLIPIYWVFGRTGGRRRSRRSPSRPRPRCSSTRSARAGSSRARRARCRALATLQPVPRLARRPRQPRDPRPAARRRVVLLTLLAAERRPRGLPFAVALGLVLGLAILGNSRLAPAAARHRRLPPLA